MCPFGHIFPFRRKRDLWSLFALFRVRLVVGKLSNRTIDDEGGDSATGFKPLYYPPQDWFLGSTCPQKGCPIVLDPTKTSNGTWHESVTPAGDRRIHYITIQFTGIALFVYGVVPNAYPNATTLTNMTFSLDQSDPEVYTHIPDSTNDILYQQLLYTRTNLSNTNHVLVMVAQPGSIAMFDYAEYTFDDESSPSPPLPTGTASVSPSPAAEHRNSSFPSGAVVGGVVGGVGGLFLAATIALLCYVRNRGLLRQLASGRSRRRDRSFVQIDHENRIPLEPRFQPPPTQTNSPTLAAEVSVSGVVSDTDCEVYSVTDPRPFERSQVSGDQEPPHPGSLSSRLDILEVEVAKLWEQHGTPPPQYAP